MPNGTPDALACPSDESLVAYVTTGLSDGERGDIETHLRGCDRCVVTAAMMQHRVALADEIPVAVPSAVIDRVRGSSPLAALGADAPVTARPRGWLAAVREWASPLLHLPVLVPSAMVAVVLLLVVTQHSPTTPSDHTRSLPAAQTSLRVTGNTVPVHAQPSSRSETLAELARGTQVVVRGEERDWYSVELPDGRAGWVEREAFE